MEVSTQELHEIAEKLARSTMERWDERVRQAEQRIYGWEAIAAEIERLRGVRCTTKTVRRWWRARRLPVDRDPLGYSVTRWELERWLRAHPVAPGEDSAA